MQKQYPQIPPPNGTDLKNLTRKLPPMPVATSTKSTVEQKFEQKEQPCKFCGRFHK